MKHNYIIIEGEKDIRCQTIEDVVRVLVDERYYEMPDQQKKEVLDRKAAANSLNTDQKFVLDDEITYVLSLLRNEIVYLLEYMGHRELTKDIDCPENGKNYIVVNNFADRLLSEYQKKRREETKDEEEK